MKWRKINITYESIMILMVVISLIMMLSDGETKFKYVHKTIWVIFLVDVVIRFIRASIKWNYIKNNTFDIVSVIPLEDMFLLARFARFLRLFRYKNIIKRYLDKISDIVERVGFIKVSFVVVLINIVVSVVITIFTEEGIWRSFYWVGMNFFKFNYQSQLQGLIVVSVGLKILGVLYMGIVVNRLLGILKKVYEFYKDKKEVKKDKGVN